MPNDERSAILPFTQFLNGVAEAKVSQFTTPSNQPGLDHTGFEQIRSHILELYRGVTPQHSFADDSGQIFDCVPLRQQPSLRNSNAAVASPADMPQPDRNRTGGTLPSAQYQAQPARPMFNSGMSDSAAKDRFGNLQNCPEGTIPMRRITLDEISRLGSLSAFLRKAPVIAEAAQAHAVAPHDSLANHRWAHANQVVNNHGGHSFVNIWQPAIGKNQVFSLAQHWYTGGAGASLQTAEAGWQVYPGKYGDAKPHLFIYWTTDNYNKTGGYNMDVSGFVHTNKQYGVGGAISPVSTTGGTQYEYEIAFWLNGSNWWLYVGGTAAANAIGYYPTSIYNHGQMATNATQIDFGGEVDGNNNFSNMGSGAFASSGWQKAAYQKDVYYYTTANTVTHATLTAQQATPRCFTCQLEDYASPWFKSFFFGGPGGTSC